MIYTDNTPLPFGRYKFVALSRIPPDYLLNLYNNPNNHKNKELQVYLETNIEKVKQRLVESTEPAPFEFPCKKFLYATEALAKAALKRIAPHEQEHKKPVRCYECPTCGGWHLTSIPFSAWQQSQVSEKGQVL